ncbi:hypothetical protein ABT336_13230 [Micromonospora sp. NPDC000207]|uniref:hypothetical protein n=1 Tax=Micromonospora sp. NPDC000207 TaxID=3154246 RepID=UPI003333BE6D
MELPAGTVVELRPGKWQLRPGSVGDVIHHVRVVKVHESLTTGWMWVYAHDVTCAWPEADCAVPWCLEFLASEVALRAAVDGGR